MYGTKDEAKPQLNLPLNIVPYEGNYPVLYLYPAEQFDAIVAFVFTRRDGTSFTLMKPYSEGFIE